VGQYETRWCTVDKRGEPSEHRGLVTAGRLVDEHGRVLLMGHDLGAKRSERSLAGGDPYVVSVPEAARVLGISKDLAYDLARRGELPGAFHLGRRWRVSLVKLRAAVHGTEHGPAKDAG
jgi:excisionase family DNA binding protein